MKLFKKFRKILSFGSKTAPTEAEERNDFDDAALLQEVGDKISKAGHTPEPPDEHFAYSLRAKILARRHAKEFSMDKVLAFINVWLAPKRLAPVVAVLVIIGLAVNLLPYQGIVSPDFNPFREFSRLLVSPAYAMDNFTLEPEAIDSLGVAGDSAYILKSKEVLESSLIRESLQVEPEVAYDLEQLSDKEWKIKPKIPLPANTIFKVSLKTSFYGAENRLESRDYSWAYQVKDSFRILTHIPGDRTTGVPTNSGIEITFSHDNFKDIDKYITVEPVTAGHFEKNGRTAVFVAEQGLAKSTIYAVTIEASLPLDGSDFKLAENYSFSFETEGQESFGRSESYFNIYERFLEFGTKEKPVVQVYASGGESGQKVDVSIFNLGGRAGYLGALKKADQIPWWAYSKD
ncbi:MAG: Ig-like domain-containing protein, partial [Candidatus Komeilibacteria bacterium]|nr:Ig-like domain-containing protein [Candidatus Komeilibacteria bacterium]